MTGPECSVPEALARMLAACPPLPAETVPLAAGLGRVLAAPVVARQTQPPFAASMMDGWAVRAADVAGAGPDAPVTLRRIGEAAAGHGFAGTVGPGEAVRIFTGAPIPPGADAVVMQEDCRDDGATVRIGRAVGPGRFVRPSGHDFGAGDAVLPAGRRLTSRDVALAAGADVPWLSVHRRPRVAVLATGDEIRLPGEPPAPGRIVSSNAFGLCALVESQGGVALNLGVAPDSAADLAERAAAAAGTDLLVTAGGTAEGDRDFVRSLPGARTPLVDGVAMRPARRLLFAAAGGSRLLALPGNPVSALVAAVLFLRPMLRVLQGLPHEPGPRRFARLDGRLPAGGGRADFPRAALSVDAAGELVVTPLPRQDVALTSAIAAADALIVRPPDAAAAEPGTPVEIIPLAGGCLKL
ncbi:gephyrin-like molybdotransferase Glp [Azospirillum halopraeferens]|uniref:molybdopterin molybdotransferase MoeA n=1 Tax=Azospirillum halopraeferens TaxID=34010 RepID=UPI00048EDB97|nr:gephyrin-like molybdotransferase Glp [Azospirillum halopraeferens]